MLAVGFGVEYFSDFVFKFTLNFNWGRWGLNSVRNFIRDCRLKHRNIGSGHALEVGWPLVLELGFGNSVL